MDVGNKVVGFGMILRDSYGAFIKSFTKTFSGLLSPLLAEACCLKEAILWIKSLGLSNFILEMDAKGVVDKYYSFLIDVSELGTVIGVC